MRWNDIQAISLFVKAEREASERVTTYNKKLAIADANMRTVAAVMQCGKLTAVSVLLALYSPLALAGKRLPQNMRRKISAAAQCKSGYVSKNKNKILWLYDHERAFKREVDAATRSATKYIETMTIEKIYITRNKMGDVELFVGKPQRDEQGFWMPTDGCAFSSLAEDSPAYGLLLPWIEKAKWEGEPIAITLTAGETE